MLCASMKVGASNIALPVASAIWFRNVRFNSSGITTLLGSSMMHCARHLIVVTIFSSCLAGCVAATMRVERFTCDRTVSVEDLEGRITNIAKEHLFYPAPPEKRGWRFYSHLEHSPSLFAVPNKSSDGEVILGVSVLRGSGEPDRLPPEVNAVFDEIVQAFASIFEKQCLLLKTE